MNEPTATDIEAERDMIGAILVDPSTIWEVREEVRASDISDANARNVFVTVEEMVRDGVGVSIETVRDRLREAGRAPAGEVVGQLVGFLVDTYTNRVPSGAHAREHARTVRRQSIRRQAVATASAFVAAIETGDPRERINDLTQRLGDLAEERETGRLVRIQDAACAALDARHNPQTPYLSTGYASLDDAIRGFGRGELVVLAGRPYIGKTIFALGLACRMSWIEHRRVVFVSLEMDATALGEAALLAVTHTTAAQLSDPANLETIRQKIAEQLGTTNVLIDRRHRLTANSVPSVIRGARARHGADVVVIDNLHLMEDEDARRHGNRVQEIAAITRALKVAASETGTVVIAISHLNRSADHRDDHRPVLSDLRDSGAIEQDADVVAFLHREDSYATRRAGAPLPQSVRAELIVRKRRGGQPATVPFDFFPASCAFHAVLSANHAATA